MRVYMNDTRTVYIFFTLQKTKEMVNFQNNVKIFLKMQKFFLN